MEPCDLECGVCESCVEWLVARADDARADYEIERIKDERHFND